MPVHEFLAEIIPLDPIARSMVIYMYHTLNRIYREKHIIRAQCPNYASST